MKKIFSILMVAFMAAAIVSCDKDDSSSNNSTNGGGNGGNTGSGSPELANTGWQANFEDDPVYHCLTIYVVSFDGTNQVSFLRYIDGLQVVMSGTYDYANGNGTAYVKYTMNGPEGDNNEYRFTFTVSGNTLNFNVSGRTISLEKQIVR